MFSETGPPGAEALFRESLALRRQIYGNRPNDRLATDLESFALFLLREGKLDEAHALATEAVAMNQAVFGDEHTATASSLDTLGSIECTQRKFGECAAHCRASMQTYLALAAKGEKVDDDLNFARQHLARALIEIKSYDEAGSVVAAALAGFGKTRGEGSVQVAATRSLTARIALERGDHAAALDISESVLAMLAKIEPPPARDEVDIRQIRARVFVEAARLEEALAETDRALTLEKATAPDAHSKLAALLALRARIEHAIGNTAEEKKSLTEAQAFKVPAALLSPEDATTLATP